jgi:hypothetical protein
MRLVGVRNPRAASPAGALPPASVIQQLMIVTALLAAPFLSTGVRAQLPLLPPQSYFSIGTMDWVIPCGPYFVDTQLTTTPWDRVADPSYTGGSGTTYSCRLGGIFYLRAVQRDASCANWQLPGTTPPPVFLFGPRSQSIVPINLPLLYPGQNYVFSGLTVAYPPSHVGPWELNSSVDCWAAQVNVPNNPIFVGSEWAAQAVFFTVQTGCLHFGTSRYTRIL